MFCSLIHWDWHDRDIKTPCAWQEYWNTLYLSLETAHSRAHDLVHQQQVGGDDGAAVDHLSLDSEEEINQSEMSIVVIWPIRDEYHL